jgi:hypothetical protein
MRGTIMRHWGMRVRLGHLALLAVLTVGCESKSMTTPTPSPTPSRAPSEPAPAALNTLFLPAPLAPPDPAATSLVGRYRLEIDADERVSGFMCESVPSAATRRSYTADIHDLGAHYAVRLYDAAFLADSSQVGYGCGDSRLPQSGRAACHQFLLKGDADALSLTAEAEDEWRGTEIWEALPDKFVLALTGRAAGAVRDGRIEAIGAGNIWYGNGLPASIYYGCRVNALRFTFTPR